MRKSSDAIFGDTRKEPKDVKPTVSEKKPAKLRSKKILLKKRQRNKDLNVIPDLSINYDEASLPLEARNIDPSKIQNLVNVPERLLLQMRSNAEARSQSYSKFLLQDVMPLVMSLDAGTNFVQTALADGVGLNVDIDSSVNEAIQNLIKLDTIVFFLKRTKIPLKFKHLFLEHLVKIMAENSVTKMDQHQKKLHNERLVKDLEGVVVRSRSKDIDEKIQRTLENHRDAKQASKTTRIVQDSGLPGASRRRRS